MFGAPGERRYACVEPLHMQRAVETGDGVPLERYDSEEECEAGCTALARLPPVMTAEVGGYLPPGALAVASRAGVPLRAGEVLRQERAACADVAARFPEAWRQLFAGDGEFRADPALLERRCAEWGVSCTRPCAAIRARMDATYVMPLRIGVDMTSVQTWGSPGNFWTVYRGSAGPLSDARFRSAPGNAPFYARSALGAGGDSDVLPVFLPGNTIRVLMPIAYPDRPPVERWGYVSSIVSDVEVDSSTGLLVLVVLVEPARGPAHSIPSPYSGYVSEEMTLHFPVPPPPGETEPGNLVNTGEDALEPAGRYAAYIRDILGLQEQQLYAAYEGTEAYERVRYWFNEEVLRKAFQRLVEQGFMAQGLPAQRATVRIFVR